MDLRWLRAIRTCMGGGAASTYETSTPQPAAHTMADTARHSEELTW